MKTADVMTTWLNLVAIGLGGAAGSVCRYLVTVAAAAVSGGSTFWGTTLVNVLGCAALGALAEYVRVTQDSLIDSVISARATLAIRFGFLGALTTFSAFAAELFVLADTGRWFAAGLYVAGNFLIGLLALIVAAMFVKGWMT